MMEMELTGFRYKGFHVWQIQTDALPEAIRGTAFKLRVKSRSFLASISRPPTRRNRKYPEVAVAYALGLLEYCQRTSYLESGRAAGQSRRMA
jgi:hypothetical protein